MPQVREIGLLIEGKRPLAGPLPEFYEERAHFHELTIRFSTIPLSSKLPSLLREVNRDLPEDKHLTVFDIIQSSKKFEMSQMRWQSIRLEGEEKGGPNPTGFEHFHMNSSKDRSDVALHIALLGLKSQEQHREVIGQILTAGFKSLSLSQLLETDAIINALLANEKKQMSGTARAFREEMAEYILGGPNFKGLPPDLIQSYYFMGDNNEIIAVGTTLKRPPAHASFRGAIDWQEVYSRAKNQGVLEYNVQDLQRGLKIIDLLGHGMGSFNGGFLRLVKKLPVKPS